MTGKGERKGDVGVESYVTLTKFVGLVIEIIAFVLGRQILVKPTDYSIMNVITNGKGIEVGFLVHSSRKELRKWLAFFRFLSW